MPNIFISYRHTDTEGYVGRLYDHLVKVFDEKEIFRDLNSLQGGEEFSPTCEKAVEACDVFLAIIGPSWLNVRDDKGRRLDNPKDVVRHEIATALKKNKRLIPVSVGHASIPKAQDLPDEISTLFEHKAIEISSERFAYDVERLIQAIGGAYGKVHVFGQALGHKSPLPQFIQREPDEKFRIQVDGDTCAELEGSESVTLQVAAGVHTICVRGRSHAWEKFREVSNELRFELKGGQVIHFSFIREPGKPINQFTKTPSIQKGRIILRHEQPLVKA